MNLWFLITLSSAFLISAMAAYLGVRAVQVLRVKQPGLKNGADKINIPMALLQKRSLWSILSTGIGCLIMLWVFTGHAVTEFFENDRLRVSLTIILTLTLLANLYFLLPTSRRGRWARMLDERDQLVLSRATNFQVVGLMCLNIIWTVGLTEYYWQAGLIPVDMPYLMLWSQFLMLFLSRSVGIVYGYWWINNYGK